MKQIFVLFFFLLSSVCQSKIAGDSSFAPKAGHPAFTNAHPVLCIDHGHHNLAIDDGRYAPIIGLLESDGFQVRSIDGRFTSQSLSDCEVLYISAARGLGPDGKENQSSAFDSKEIGELKKMVASGGGLLIATDHPNMAQASELVIEAFGVNGSQATTKDLEHTIPSLKDPGVIVFKADAKGDKTGIFSGRSQSENVSTVVIFDGQSLSSPRGTALLKFQNSAKDEAPDHSVHDGRRAVGNDSA